MSSGDEERSEGTWTSRSWLGVAGAWALYFALALDDFLEWDCRSGDDVSACLPLFGAMVSDGVAAQARSLLAVL